MNEKGAPVADRRGTYERLRDELDAALVALALILATDCDTLKPTHHDIARRALTPSPSEESGE